MVKSENTCLIRSEPVGMALEHAYTIPVEWKFDNEENMGGDYAGAAILPEYQRVTVMACVCGKEIQRARNGERKL